MKRFSLKLVFFALIFVALGVTVVKLILGETLVTSTLPIDDNRIPELYLPAKHLAARNSEIEHITLFGGKLTILTKKKHQQHAISLVENWLQEKNMAVHSSSEIDPPSEESEQ